MKLPQMMYNKITEDYFFNPKHVGRLDLTKAGIFHINVTKTSLVIDLYVEYSNKVIQRAVFKTNGSPYVISSLEWLCRQIEGRSLGDLPDINYQRFVEVLEIPPIKYPEAVLIERVYKELIKRLRL